MQLIKTESFQLASYSKGNPNAEKLALVLPGKLDTKDYSHMKSHVEYLANLGYFALSFDPPGTWESPGDISLYTMTNYLKAVDELISYYGNKPTFVMGHSRGGSITTIAGVKNKYIFAFAAIMSSLAKEGYLKNKDKGWKTKGYMVSMRDLPPGGGRNIKEFRLPYGFHEDEMRYDLTDEITSSPKPKLFILGKQDSIVAPDKVRQTYAAFAEPKELYELDSDHDYRLNPDSIEEVNAVVGNFLANTE